MRTAVHWVARLVAAYLALGIAPGDDEEEQFRKRCGTAVVSVIALVAIPDGLQFLLLDRPVTALVEITFLVASVALLVHLFITRDGYLFLRGSLLIGFLNPILIMWSLGGFAQGGAAIMWSFSIPLAALIFWGARPAQLWAVACAGALIVSALLEDTLSTLVDPLPSGEQTILFVFVIASSAAVNLAVIFYFARQRNMALARSDTLLLNILPAPIASRLKDGQSDVADGYPAASVLFVDIVEFTAFAESRSPERVVELLGRVFATLDNLVETHGLEKIKTLGDGYLAVAGVPIPRADHAVGCAQMALAIPAALTEAVSTDWSDLRVRIGIASGPLVAGVIGRRRFSYDIWGDTVNTASRMASLAAPGSVVITAETAALLQDSFELEPLAETLVKGKGMLRPFRLSGLAQSA